MTDISFFLSFIGQHEKKIGKLHFLFSRNWKMGEFPSVEDLMGLILGVGVVEANGLPSSYRKL